VAVSNIDSNTVQILLGNGNGTFTVGETIFLDATPASITATDFNNDGKMDLAVGIGFISSQGVVMNEVEILRGDGTGLFTNVATVVFGNGGSLVTKVRVGDFNRDGMPDIAVLQNQDVWALFGNGDFSFDGVLIQHYAQTTDMNTSDMDQDSFTDILVSSVTGPGSRNGGVEVFLGTPTHSLTHKNLIPSGGALYEAPSGLIAADVNGDGINDLIGLDTDSTSANGVYVWICNGEGSCSTNPTKYTYTTDRDTTALVAGDFNRDGKIDFAAIRGSNSTLEVLLNATPRGGCQNQAVSLATTICQPQESTFSNSPLHIVAQTPGRFNATDMHVYIDNVLKGQFSGSAVSRFFDLPDGDHFVVVKGFDSSGTS